MTIVHAVLLIGLLLIVARLLELQILKGNDYHELAQAQHFGGVTLPARRGEILSTNAKTAEKSILATNTTLDLVYVDPIVTDNATLVAETLSDILVTETFHEICKRGEQDCPRELVEYYEESFDPLSRVQFSSGTLLEPEHLRIAEGSSTEIDLTEVRRQFARDIERRIGQDRVRYVPLVYGATKVQMELVDEMRIAGVTVSEEQNLIYADPEEIPQLSLGRIARSLSDPIQMEQSTLRRILRSRPLRYVPVMRKLPPELSSSIRSTKLESIKKTRERKRAAATREEADTILDPLRSIALIPEHWRFYPDGTVGSHVLGFLNNNQQPQYGVERTFNIELKGKEGLINAVSDPQGGQILTSNQTIRDPEDGDTINLTIDRFVQEEVERILEEGRIRYEAESGQAIVMDPDTGRIIALANVPLFDSNLYGGVFTREPLYLSEQEQVEIVIELSDPETNAFVLKAYIGDVYTEEGRKALSDEKQEELSSLERLYELPDITRYYHYVGENHRYEIFPTEDPAIWLKYENMIGVGAYLNRTIQSIYEPGSVIKPITMAIALDQGEITPSDTYLDNDPVEVDEFTIRNALNAYYGEVTMTNCLEFSVNTCMTTVSTRLGKKLFHRALERFGFGRTTGIELDDEQPGDMLPWRQWSNALLATSAYGQGISATPLQVVTAFSALANGGKLLKPTIIDSIEHSDGTVEKTPVRVLDQVITPETSDTITAMLTSTVTNGFAKTAKVPGYRIAGKTGTSQIAGPGGKYESGTGSTITSFAGYAPVNDPQFVVFVKYDRPMAKDIEYGSKSAAPVFKEIAEFLFGYLGVEPDEL